MEKQEIVATHSTETHKKIVNMKSYIAALLMFVPSMTVQSEDVSSFQKDAAVASYHQFHDKKEGAERIVSYEAIFKDGIKKSLTGLNSIDQIPEGGYKITYYRDSGSLQGKPISPESVKALNLPDKFNISPRKIDTPVESMYFTLGNRVFSITPDIGSIAKITLNEKALVVKISALFGIVKEDIIYDKGQKLPDLMYRLRMSPKGAGKKEGFRSTTVTEI